MYFRNFHRHLTFCVEVHFIPSHVPGSHVVLMSALVAAVVMCGEPLRAEIAKPEQPQAMFPVGLGEKSGQHILVW